MARFAKNFQTPKLGTLRSRLIAALILTSVFPLILLGTYAAWRQSNHLVKDSERRQIDAAEIASREISTLVNEYRLDATAIAQLPSLIDNEPAARSALLNQLHQAYARYEHLSLRDPNSGQRLYSTVANVALSSKHQTLFDQAVETRAQTWSVAQLSENGRLGMQIFTPIVQDGIVVGVLESPVPLVEMRQLMSNLVLHNECEVIITDQAGSVFLDTSQSQSPNQGADPVANRQVLPNMDMNSGVYIERQGGKRELVAYVTVPEANWTIFVEQDLDAVLASTRTERLLLAAGVLFTTLFSGAVAFVLGNNLTAPISTIEEALEAFGSDDAERVQIANGTQIAEFNSLLRSFELMRTAVADREAQLALAEQANRAIISAIPDSLVQCDPAGTVTSVDLAEPFASIDAFNTLQPGHDFFERVNFQLLEPAKPLRPPERNAESGTRVEHIIVHDENQLVVEFRFRTSADDQMLVVMRDLTTQRIAQDRLNQAQKFESIGVLAGGLSHDFNNLLTAILGHLSIAQRKIGVDSKAQVNLTSAVEASQQAAALIAKLRGLSGQALQELTPVDMHELINSNLALFQTVLPRNVTFSTELNASTSVILGDSSQLQQVIMNLLINAAEAFDENDAGEIFVRLDQVMVTSSDTIVSYQGVVLDPGSYVAIEIADTGSGMDVTTLNRIFDPYFSTKQRGSGLGLTAVLSSVNAHNGVLQAFSAPALGTTIRLFFPAVFDAVEANAEERVEYQLPPASVLVVDDDPMTLQALQAMLDMPQLEVITASDGLEAIRIYKRLGWQIDAIILDIRMPGIDGFETFRRLRAFDHRVKIIFSSGYYEEIPAQYQLDFRNVAILHKPFGYETVIGALAKALSVTTPV